MKFYGITYENGIEPEAAIENLVAQGAVGLCHHTYHLDARTHRLAKLAKGAGLDFILGTRYIPPQADIVRDCMKLSNKLAFGNDELGEWNGSAELAARYLDDADRCGYEWICTIIHPCIVKDVVGSHVIRWLLRDTQCFCLTGYILSGYLYADPRIPCHRAGMMQGEDPNQKYGLSIESLTEYLRPMNVWCGAGFQGGLTAGSYVYAERLGFKGMIAGVPFTVPKKVSVNDAPKQYPAYFGSYV